MDAIVGSAHTVSFDLQVGVDYVDPDAGSVTYTVRDNTGAAISGQTDIEVDDNDIIDQSVTITVPSGSHTITGSRDYEQRTVQLKFTVDGQSYSFLKHYYVTPWLNYRVEPISVLGLIGLKEGEVWADQVDLVRSYYMLKSQLGGAVLDTALASGTAEQFAANEAIRYFAAIDMIRCIELKALRKAGGDSMSYQRFEKIDFASVRGSLELALTDLINGFDTDTADTPVVFLVSNPTNPITGA